MRSLWRVLALRWLGGEGSEVLAANSSFVDFLTMGENERRAGASHVERDAGVSHHAMMAPGDPGAADTTIEGVVAAHANACCHRRCSGFDVD